MALKFTLDTKTLQQQISELKERNKMLENLVDMLPQIIVETDLSGNIIYVNRKAFELTGYTNEDINKGLHASEFVVPAERELLNNNMQRVLQGEELHGSEYTALRKDGTTFSVLVYSSHKIEDEETSNTRSIILDITERKKDELIIEDRIKNLQNAIAQIKSLQGIIPICMHCKQIRDDKGFWHRVETYIEGRSDAKFSHGICPSCIDELHPEVAKKMKR